MAKILNIFRNSHVSTGSHEVLVYGTNPEGAFDLIIECDF